MLTNLVSIIKNGCESMNDKTTGEQSPFYIEYTGTTKYKKNTIPFHPKQDFNNDLREFFKIRFGADISDNKIMEEIVHHYYFSFAHERTYYQRTIIALIHKNEINKENPTIFPMLLSPNFARSDNGALSNDKQHKKITTFQFHAYTRWYKDIDIDLKDRIVKRIFNDGYAIDRLNVFDRLKNFDESKLNDFIVLEIALNNYLDTKKNGVYGYLQEDNVLKENQHVGVVIANTHSEIIGIEPFAIAFNWKLNFDFSIDVLDMVKLSESNLARLIDKYNYGLIAVLSPILNFSYSKQKKLAEKDRLIEELESMLEFEKAERLKLVDEINKSEKQSN